MNEDDNMEKGVKDEIEKYNIDYFGEFTDKDRYEDDEFDYIREDNQTVRKIIKVLSKGQYTSKSFKKIKKQLDKINSDKQSRYNYYDIYVLICDSNRKTQGLDCILTNVRRLEDDLRKESGNNTLKTKDSKLIQYIKLEAQRFQNRNLDLEKQEKQIDDITSKAKKVTENINRMDKKLKLQQTEFISILGIFSAMVLGFTGGLSFTTSVLDNINNVGIYRLLMIVILLGFMLINCMYFLLDFLLKISDKKVSLKKAEEKNKIDNDSDSETYDRKYEKSLLDEYLYYDIYKYYLHTLQDELNNELDIDSKFGYNFYNYMLDTMIHDSEIYSRYKEKTFLNKIMYYYEKIVNIFKGIIRSTFRKVRYFERIFVEKGIVKINVALLIMLILVIGACKKDFFKEEEKMNKNIAKYEQLKKDLAAYDKLLDTDKDGNKEIKLKVEPQATEEPKATDKPKTTQKSKEKENKDK